jgi:hypothetical protein
MNRRLPFTFLCLAFLHAPIGNTFAAEAHHNAPVDARYTAEGLKRAFSELCARLDYKPLRVEVDESESPYIVYGVLEGRGDYKAMRDALHSMPGYAYSGSVVASNRDGSRTVFALNMVPRDGTPDMQHEMERMKQLATSQR